MSELFGSSSSRRDDKKKEKDLERNGPVILDTSALNEEFTELRDKKENLKNSPTKED